MHKPLILANWKSNKRVTDARAWLELFHPSVDLGSVNLVVLPPFTQLDAIGQDLVKAKMLLGAQDASPFPLGSYTGAIAAEQLSDLGVSYVLVGHSERRRYFHEDSEMIARKTEQVLLAGMTPVVCVDESDIDAQATALARDLYSKCVFAYEPVGAIGTGNNQPVDEVARVRERITEVFGAVSVLYGGSVDEQNVGEYLLVSDGVLVGSASLDPQSFARLVESASV